MQPGAWVLLSVRNITSVVAASACRLHMSLASTFYFFTLFLCSRLQPACARVCLPCARARPLHHSCALSMPPPAGCVRPRQDLCACPCQPAPEDAWPHMLWLPACLLAHECAHICNPPTPPPPVPMSACPVPAPVPCTLSMPPPTLCAWLPK